MTILVTGSKGGFGRVLIPQLRIKYQEPIIGSGRLEVRESNYYCCDLTNSTSVVGLIKKVKPRLVFHLAGSFTGQFENDFKVNVLSTKYIFDAILSENLDTRVVILGSAAEYGAVLPEANPISESFQCDPVSVYGLTKYYQTELSKFYMRISNIDVVNARVFNLAIPGLSPRLFYGRLEALIAAYKNKEISRMEFGNLSSERDYIGLEQALTQLLVVAERGKSGEIYNLGSGAPRSIRSILYEELNKNEIPNHVATEVSSESVSSKGVDVPLIYADISKVISLL